MIARARAALVLAALATACGSGADRPKAPSVARDPTPRVEDAFDGPPDLLVVVRPAKLLRDPLYGPLLRAATRMASTRAALAAAVGTTALAAIERADEVILGVYDPDARDAVVAIRGVPADVDPTRVVDTDGRPLWGAPRDLPRGAAELAPADGSTSASLFVLPRRAWVIGVGAAAVRVRNELIEDTAGAPSGLDAIDPAPLAIARLRGDALIRARPALAKGALAPLVASLAYVTLSLEPGPEGQVGEVRARFVYDDEPSAVAAESTARDVLGAFTRKYEKEAPWLHAVAVARTERAVTVRGRIPRAWADGLIHLDLDAAP